MWAPRIHSVERRRIIVVTGVRSALKRFCVCSETDTWHGETAAVCRRSSRPARCWLWFVRRSAGSVSFSDAGRRMLIPLRIHALHARRRHVIYGHVLKMHQTVTSRLVSESIYSYFKETTLGPSFSSPAFSIPVDWSVWFQSCIFSRLVFFRWLWFGLWIPLQVTNWKDWSLKWHVMCW